jgi:hypothetical protein
MNAKRINRLFRPLLLILLMAATVLIALPAHAQSTDRNNPTPWPQGGLNAIGNVNAVTSYYYVMEAGPGTLEIYVQAIARQFTTGIAVDLLEYGFRDFDPSIARVAFFPGTGRAETRTERVTIVGRRRLIVRLTIDGSLGNYIVRITETPGSPTGVTGGTGSGTTLPSGGVEPVVGVPVGETVPLPAPMMKELGDGTARISRYSFDAWPGVISVYGEASATRGTTRLKVAIIDAAGRNLGGVDITAPDDVSRTATSPVTVTRRQALVMEVTRDANLGPYTVYLNGPINRPAWDGYLVPLYGALTRGHGNGTRRVEYHTFEADQGYITVNANMTSTSGNGSLQIDVFNEDGQNLAGTVVTSAPGTMSSGTTQVVATGRCVMIMRLIFDEYVGDYRVWLTGSLAR